MKKKKNSAQIKSIAKEHFTKRDCSVQEEVYPVINERWIRKCSANVLFINSNFSDNYIDN